MVNMPTPQMCYKTNFLSKIILRADFSNNPLGQLSEKSTFSNAIASIFPHTEAKPLVETFVSISPDGIGGEQKRTGTQWDHRKEVDGTASVSLAPTFLALEYGPGDYFSFEGFQAEFTTLFNALTDNFGIAQIDRIGLRYINEIRLPGRAMDWAGIIAANLITSVKTSMLAEARLLRSMHQVVQKSGHDQVVLNYGIVNPDYPAPVVQRHFILDIDCSREGVIESGDALACVKDLNTLATEIFEESIDNDLRQRMEIVR